MCQACAILRIIWRRKLPQARHVKYSQRKHDFGHPSYIKANRQEKGGMGLDEHLTVSVSGKPGSDFWRDISVQLCERRFRSSQCHIYLQRVQKPLNLLWAVRCGVQSIYGVARQARECISKHAFVDAYGIASTLPSLRFLDRKEQSKTDVRGAMAGI